MISLLASATATPPHQFSTTELIAALMFKLSPELINTISTLGVDQRYSTLANFPDYLTGQPMYPTTSATALGIDAVRKCIAESGRDPRQIGLLIAATNTPDQLLPCLASEVMGSCHGLLSRSISTVSMQAQGCSVLLKAIEVARWYLCANPTKTALVLMSEAHTPHIAPLLRDEYHGYRELARQRRYSGLNTAELEQQRLDTTFVIQAMLFGDGAVALLLGLEDGVAGFGPIEHLTNDAPEDVSLLSMDWGSLQRSVNGEPDSLGRPHYFMRPNVPLRGAHYAVTTVRKVLAHPDSPVHSLEDVAGCLIHTGSKKILDGVCTQLDLAPDSGKVRTSYDILNRYGNLSSASTGFMLAEKTFQPGPAMVVGFGVGFAASAGVVSFN